MSGYYSYVDAEALMDYANNLTVGVTANDIARFPKAKVRPDEEAKWIMQDRNVIGEMILRCSECGDVWTSFRIPNFCPNCGRRMVKEETDEPR